jgi:uncharacterized membrane protein YheB (UPF0754 family)
MALVLVAGTTSSIAMVVALGALPDDWWRYAIIPIVAALTGWGTNWLAVKMTFWPIEFVGIRPVLGWQGIIPRNARKMASIATDSSITRIGTLTDVVRQMEPDAIAAHVLRAADDHLPDLVADMASRQAPRVWANLPEPIRQAVIERARHRLPAVVDSLVADMTANIEQILDMRLMVVERLSSDRRLLNRIFLESGAKEFRFLVNSGFWFGGLLGIVQMILWILWPTPWLLPVAGFMVGYLTNWAALYLIFEPVEPRRIGPWVLQGLFLKRQDEISAYFADTASQELLTIRHFVDRMLNGPRSDRAMALIRRHIEPSVDEALGIARVGVEAAVGSREYQQVKDRLFQRAVELGPEPFDDPEFVASRGRLVRQEMYLRLSEMSPLEFTELLRPTVEEDEWKLIAVGAALGALAGFAQSVLVFGGTL